MSEIAARVAAVRGRIDAALARSGRAHGTVTLVAVAKTFPAEAVAEAARAGLTAFGENRVQEGSAKIPRVSSLLGAGERGADLRGGSREAAGGGAGRRDARLPYWHLVGHLQSNKAKAAAGLFDLIHSVDDTELAVKLDRAARELGKRQSILVQVNVAGEAAKSGVPPGELRALVEGAASLENLEVRGLMTIPPYDPDPERSRGHFAALGDLGRQVRVWLGPDLAGGELSMGMSEDFEVAIEEGATIVRVGRAIFGERR